MTDLREEAPREHPARASRARSVDVAAAAGVSRATVSRILNGHGAHFSGATVEKVQAVAAEMGYVPSAAGRTLVRGRSDVVLIVLPFVTLTHLQDIVDAVAEDLAAHRLAGVVVFSDPGRDQSRLRRLAESLRVAGIVDLGGVSEADHEALAALHVPVIGPAADTHSLSNLTIARVQAEHLLARGAGSLAYVFAADERGRPYDADRAEGMRRVCAEAGIAPPYLVDTVLEPAAVAEALGRLVTAVDTPLGIACAADELALGLVNAAREMELPVPGRVAVVGAGDTAVARLARPRLSSLSADTHSLLGQVRAALAREFGTGSAAVAADAGFDSIVIVQGETT